MKRAFSIGVILVASVLTSNIVFGQQTSSAVQVVTFGVARTAQMVVRSLNSAPEGRVLALNSETQTLQHRLAEISAKVTFSAKTLPAAGTHQRESLIAPAPGTDLNSTSWVRGNDGCVQTDLRTFLEEKESSPTGISSLVFTITD